MRRVQIFLLTYLLTRCTDKATQHTVSQTQTITEHEHIIMVSAVTLPLFLSRLAAVP